MTFGTFGTVVIWIHKNGDSVSETLLESEGYWPRLSFVGKNLYSVS